MLKFSAINGKDIRVMYYVHNPSLRKRGVGNIFIKVHNDRFFFPGLVSKNVLLSFV